MTPTDKTYTAASELAVGHAANCASYTELDETLFHMFRERRHSAHSSVGGSNCQRTRRSFKYAAPLGVHARGHCNDQARTAFESLVNSQWERCPRILTSAPNDQTHLHECLTEANN